MYLKWWWFSLGLPSCSLTPSPQRGRGRNGAKQTHLGENLSAVNEKRFALREKIQMLKQHLSFPFFQAQLQSFTSVFSTCCLSSTEGKWDEGARSVHTCSHLPLLSHFLLLQRQISHRLQSCSKELLQCDFSKGCHSFRKY